MQQQGRQRAEALAERSVEIAQAMVPLRFPWRVRSRVGVAEGVWREGCVCACEREVCLGCVRVFCV